jgi:hypothetical protein
MLIKMLNQAQLDLRQKILTDQLFYKELLINLITEGLSFLMEDDVVIRGLERDREIIQKVLS